MTAKPFTVTVSYSYRAYVERIITMYAESEDDIDEDAIREALGREELVFSEDEEFSVDNIDVTPDKTALDTHSSASRQHYIDTGEYLMVGQAEQS